MKKNSILPILAAVVLVSCGRSEKEIRVPGVVDGEIIAVKTLTGGTLERVHVSEGHAVKKNQLIAEMNRDKIANSLEELRILEKEIANGEERARKKRELLQANIGYLQKQVQHLSRLKENEAVAGDQLERTQLQLLEARTGLSDLEKSLDAFRIQREKVANKRQGLGLLEKDQVFKSPVDGVVLDVYAASGETVLPGTLLAEILDLASLYVETYVEEVEMASLKLGQGATIIPDGGGRTFAGQIAYFGRKAEFSPKYILSEKERKSLLYQVKVRITNGLEALKLGMPVTVFIQK